MSDDSTLMVKRVIDADPETIWEALTDQQIMQKWYFAAEGEEWSATVSNEPSVGGSFKIDMHGPEDTYPHEGVYKEVVPNEKLVFTWNSQAVTDTVVTITLEEVDAGTEVKLVHEFIPTKKEKEAHTRGWTQILVNLEEVIAA